MGNKEGEENKRGQNKLVQIPMDPKLWDYPTEAVKPSGTKNLLFYYYFIILLLFYYYFIIILLLFYYYFIILFIISYI